ncbi:ARS-binding protein 2 [Colletotrichum orbiculare MAFF 240422]|uniref:ARS-binding protein 2 n=1 Tax=Colletotrichum orbiculare (strain 104-T / ATCC 96160 / CBS 514.97 / LARS 414 / MAFF 240422) TaxID=1213857 RepID=N4VZQ3_COLOR|nr:ARS-binding protein 2 [Colletotrichum orbiculare MAFF 240422]
MQQQDQDSDSLLEQDQDSDSLHEQDEDSDSLHEQDEDSDSLHEQDQASDDLHEQGQASDDLHEQDQPPDDLLEQDQPTDGLHEHHQASNGLLEQQQPLNEQSPSTSTPQQQHAAASAAPQSISSSPASARLVPPSWDALPARDVTAENIEDAYVQFIMYCNPAVPAETDTAGLREAFRVPPKSTGKLFSTFLLYQLVVQLEQGSVKTWADLALKLGVPPPDPDKGESTQKVPQYAVRLKRWIHAMHLNAFFDYLMDRPHPYFTEIPDDPSPLCKDGRDGVMALDDMALRALLPEIRPSFRAQVGKRRPDSDSSASLPSQRLRVDSPPAGSGDGAASGYQPGSQPVRKRKWVKPRHGQRVVSSVWNRGRPQLSTADTDPMSVPGLPPAARANEPPQPQPNDIPVGMFENMADRTNIEAVLGYLTHEVANADWTDWQNRPIERCSIAEATALAHTTVERMWSSSVNQNGFLLNLAALVGGRSLMTTSKMKIKREAEYERGATYSCGWEYRLGSIQGTYSMTQTVMYDRWKKPEELLEPENLEGPREPVIELETGWEKRYRDLLAFSEQRDKELQDLRSGVLATLSSTCKDAKNRG